RLAGLFDPHTSSANEGAAAALPGSKSQAPNPQLKRPTVWHSALGSWSVAARVLPRREAALLALILALFGVQPWRAGRAFEAGHLGDLATDTALLGFCALGAALVILAGGIDISLGSLMALSAAVAGSLWQEGWPLSLVLPVAVLVGGAGGLANA